jgi:pimeloyl-ACP methyl ester carboxylesterase
VNSQQGFVDANGTRLYYEMAGAGDAMVFLHGFTLDTRMWDDQFALFAGRFQAIRYDLRGFGRSALPTDAAYTHFEDLKGLLDALGIDQPHLVGLSKGGGVALDFALAFPQRVRSLVLIDAVLGGFAWSAAGSARDEAVWQAAAAGGIPAAKASWLAHPLFAPALRQPEVAARLKQIIDDYSGWHFVNANPEHGLKPPAATRLHELGAPVLAIVGEYDTPDFRAITEIISQQAPRAQALVIPGVGHMANMEAPELVNAAMLGFLADQQH